MTINGHGQSRARASGRSVIRQFEWGFSFPCRRPQLKQAGSGSLALHRSWIGRDRSLLSCRPTCGSQASGGHRHRLSPAKTRRPCPSPRSRSGLRAPGAAEAGAVPGAGAAEWLRQGQTTRTRQTRPGTRPSLKPSDSAEFASSLAVLPATAIKCCGNTSHTIGTGFRIRAIPGGQCRRAQTHACITYRCTRH